MIFLFSYLLFELIAALSGSYYVKKYREDTASRYFVYFLWFTFLIEFFGTLPGLIYYADMFPSLKGTFLEKNHWLQNIYLIINFSFYVLYLSYHYKTYKFKFFMRTLVSLFVTGAILNLIFSNVYFNAIASFTYIIGTVLILIGGFLYLYEMLQSDKILTFYKTISFYITIGAMGFHLIATPIFIYSRFYSQESPDFINIRMIILNTAIFFLYTCYTIGFIVCLKKNKSY